MISYIITLYHYSISLSLEMVFTIAAPAFDMLFDPVYWMCIEYKYFVYNCWEINVCSLLLTFKSCKMLLEDGEARRRRKKRELVDAGPSNAAKCC